MTTPRSAAGFSLVELLVAVALFGLVAAALAAIEGTAFRNQARLLSQNAAADAATLSGRALRRAAHTASYLQSPPVGAASSSLTLWDNVDPADGSSPLIASAPRRYSHFCLAGDGSLHLYRGAWPFLGAFCGGSAPAGGSHETLVGGLSGLSAWATFFRPSRPSLQVSYRVTLKRPGQPPVSVAHTTRMTVREAAQ